MSEADLRDLCYIFDNDDEGIDKERADELVRTVTDWHCYHISAYLKLDDRHREIIIQDNRKGCETETIITNLEEQLVLRKCYRPGARLSIALVDQSRRFTTRGAPRDRRS
jgi:hypothetical protein